MKIGEFREPVTVLVGIGVPVEVSDVRHALELMIDWPHRTRRTGHFACIDTCLLYTSPSPRDRQKSRMPSSA